MERRLSDALFFGSSKSRKLKFPKRQSNDRCPLGYVFNLFSFLLLPYIRRRRGVHIGVGFCVARSDWIGQCEGLVGRDE